MEALTFEAVEAEVRRLVAESPEFVYPRANDGGCVYNANDTLPACLFGQAFQNLGHPVPDDLEDKSIDAVLSRFFGLDGDDNNSIWACLVQARQDRDVPWDEALKAADEVTGKG
jgi:hypothetical protein